MKKLLVVSMFAVASLFYNSVSAQISLNVNVGSQPLWGPAGYDHVDYYYLPDVDSYYNVPKKQFVNLNNGNWVFNNSLPTKYTNYNLYNGYKVVVNGDRPYLNYKNDKDKYVKYKNWGGRQLVIKNSKDKKYYTIKGHPHGMPPGQAKKMKGSHGHEKEKYEHEKEKNKGKDDKNH